MPGKKFCTRTGNRKRLKLEGLEQRCMLTSIPVAAADTYEAFQGTELQISGPGVLENDTDADLDPLIAVIEELPSHGQLQLAPDGSFSYDADPGFVGQDTFTYRAVAPVPSTSFVVNPALSTVTVDASLQSQFGNDSDSDTSTMTGTVVARISPESEPFDEVHLTDLDLILTDGLQLSFSFAFGLAGLNANLPPNPSNDPALAPLRIQMENPGSATAVSQGNFNQAQNELRVSGIAQVDATGLADGQVPEDPLPFDDPGIFTDLAGSVAQAPGSRTITVPIAFEGEFPFDGGNLVLAINGTIVATDSQPVTPEPSAPTTVTINVTDTTPPTVIGVEVNADIPDPPDLDGQPQPSNWSTQRSSIRSIQVYFSEPVADVQALDLELMNLGVDADPNAGVEIVLTNDQINTEGSTATISFTEGELAEGVYQITLEPTIADLAGLPLDGDPDQPGSEARTIRGDENNRLYRLPTDWSGDSTVTIRDFLVFAYWYGTPSNLAPEYMDVQPDTAISIRDFLIFAQWYTVAIGFPPPATAGKPASNADSDKPSVESDAVALDDDLVEAIAWSWTNPR